VVALVVLAPPEPPLELVVESLPVLALEAVLELVVEAPTPVLLEELSDAPVPWELAVPPPVASVPPDFVPCEPAP
jgi:hypothetical protein